MSVTSTVVAVACLTVATAHLLCRQTAAQGYAEVLAHLTMHSTYPGPPPGQLSALPFWGFPCLGLPIPQGVCITGRLAH